MIVNNSTSAFFDRSTLGMTDLRKQAESLQQQMGQGERLTRSSDDPVAASRLRMLSRTDKVSEIDETSANRANADLTLADTALTSFTDYINRIKELALQASSDTLTEAQRASIGVEIEHLHGDLVALANSRDSVGHALFGGESAGDAYTLDGSGNAVYIGSGSAGELPLGDALDSVNTTRASLGAGMSRLESAVNSLTNNVTNLSDARSRIEDTDYSTETTTLAKAQILSQASTAMLSQANQSAQNVLSLLR